MVSTSQSDKISNKVSLFVGIFSLMLTLLSSFITVNVRKSITLSAPGILLLALGCGIISVIITRFFFFLDKKQKKPFHKAVISLASFCAGAFTVFVAVICIFLLQKNGSTKAMPRPEIIIDIQSSPEDLVQTHIDFIEKKISEYTESDVQQVNNKYVNFLVCENAGNLLYDSGDGSELTCEVLGGKTLASAMVIVLDYETHDIIRTYYSDERGHIKHYTTGNEKIFCVVAMPGYGLYVSEPIFVAPEIEEEFLGRVGLYLKKPGFKYNEPICIRIKVRDSNHSSQNYEILSDHSTSFRCIESDTNPSEHYAFDCIFYTVWTNGSGILSRGACSTYYFELNAAYELDISPGLPEISSGVIPYFYASPYKTISDLPNNTNLVDVCVDYDGEWVGVKSNLPH